MPSPMSASPRCIEIFEKPRTSKPSWASWANPHRPRPRYFKEMTDLSHMRAALGLARRGLGDTWPNPSVGCVIVRDGRVVGRALTALQGRPHAETQALAMAGDLARGATAYVTLEPCCFHGRTPPCTDALIAA